MRLEAEGVLISAELAGGSFLYLLSSSYLETGTGDSIDVRVAGNYSVTFERLLACLCDCGTNGYCWGICRTVPGTKG
jgi:hypothetical protein